MLSVRLVDCTPEHWDAARDWIGQACGWGGCDVTPADLYRSLMIDPAYQLLLFDTGAGVVCKEEDAIHIVAIGGRFHKGWVDDFNHWLQLACLTLGVNKATLGGRRGWERKLRHLGWTKQGEKVEVHYGQRWIKQEQ